MVSIAASVFTFEEMVETNGATGFRDVAPREPDRFKKYNVRQAVITVVRLTGIIRLTK
jgi:hypothetical protein